MSFFLARFPVFAMLAAVLLSTSCAVGPDFEKPAAPDVQGYVSEGTPAKTAEAETPGGAAQSFAVGQDIPSEWWKLFHSEPLNQLVTKALAASPDIEAARASLREAEENVRASEGAFFPSLDGRASGTREKMSGVAMGKNIPAYTLYNSSVSVSYVLDVFGGTRREVESLEALAEMQRYELEAAYLTLTSNVVTAAIQEASLREQIAATQDVIQAQEKQLELTKRQFELGAVGKPAVLAQQATLAEAKAMLPPMGKQLAQTRHLLAALVGQFPSQELAATFELSALTLPEVLPLSLPSQLVEQRPDVKAATAQMHAASAAIGVATANMLPRLALTGSYGVNAGQLADMFSPGSAIWSIGGSLLQPLFHGGELLHKKRASEAAFEKSAALYRRTVLAAFQNVADSLRAIQSDADTLKAQLSAERTAADNLKLSKEQFNAGAISYLSLLTADQAYQAAKILLVQARAKRFADTVALFQSLGGGWWNKPPETPQETKTETPTPETAATTVEEKPAADTPAANEPKEKQPVEPTITPISTMPSKQLWRKSSSSAENSQ